MKEKGFVKPIYNNFKMKSNLTITLLCLLFGSSQILATDKLGYVFELVRHGARAALIDDSEFFNVDTGMLTPSGMR